MESSPTPWQWPSTGPGICPRALWLSWCLRTAWISTSQSCGYVILDSLNSLIFPQGNIAFICGVIPKCYCFNKVFHFVCSLLSQEPTARLCAACGVPQDPSPWLPLQRKKSLPQVFLPPIQVCLAKKNKKNNHPISSSCRRNCKNSLRIG